VVRIVDDGGQPIAHTPERITELFDEELSRILRELPENTSSETIAQFKQARFLSEKLIVSGEFTPV
jgi:hypothetical protein